MIARRPKLLFVSPQFLFPMDAGGKIRTANILKNMKGGAFEIDLIAPATDEEQGQWSEEITLLCDNFTAFAPDISGMRRQVARFFSLASSLPVAVRSEARPAARFAVHEALLRKPDLVIYDYVHAMAMMPEEKSSDGPPPHKKMFFAHNVETEIFRRHHALTKGLKRLIWGGEAKKMHRFEQSAVSKVDGVIAVSARDAAMFRDDFGADYAADIPTGVDLDFFAWKPPAQNEPPEIVFTGSLDWRANQDGLFWFMNEVWPLIIEQIPDVRFRIIGKNPPDHLVNAAKEKNFQWDFTGFVDDIRDHAYGDVYVIPLRAGGGTRIKTFEAMAMGVPVVSTGIGVEGLDVKAGEHFIQGDDPSSFAQGVVEILRDREKGLALSKTARKLCEDNFSQKSVAEKFETICLDILNS